MTILEVHFVKKKVNKEKSDEWINKHHLKPIKITVDKLYRKYHMLKLYTYKKKKIVWNYKKDMRILYGESDFVKKYIEKHMPSVYALDDDDYYSKKGEYKEEDEKEEKKGD